MEASPDQRSADRRDRCWAGRNSRWRWCATRPTTPSSSAPSRTSTPWACIPATASPSPSALTLTDKEYQRMRVGLDRRDARDRRRDRRLQRPVRRSIRRTAAWSSIEMNPRVSRVQRPGLQGHRFSHRQDRRQAGRAATRWTNCKNDITKVHAGLLRADHRLCRHQDSALCLREIPRRRQPTLTPAMKSVGEAMAIGRTFAESLQKALRTLRPA